MQYIKKSVNFFNPGQTPVDVCDQPVYALTKEIQWREKYTFSSSSYFSLLAGYEALVSGMLSFNKTTRPFSSMAPHQLHEQNNEVIKSFGGEIAFLNKEDQSVLEISSLCNSELASIVADYRKS